MLRRLDKLEPGTAAERQQDGAQREGRGAQDSAETLGTSTLGESRPLSLSHLLTSHVRGQDPPWGDPLFLLQLLECSLGVSYTCWIHWGFLGITVT